MASNTIPDFPYAMACVKFSLCRHRDSAKNDRQAMQVAKLRTWQGEVGDVAVQRGLTEEYGKEHDGKPRHSNFKKRLGAIALVRIFLRGSGDRLTILYYLE
ncbi:MAG: hypothetical protein AAFY26_19965 [Cyanobacteria bacterium J06638_22]